MTASTVRKILFGILLLLAACQPQTVSPQATLTAVPIVIVKPLATLAPTMTLRDTDWIATQNAVSPTPTSARPTSTPSPTPYIGVFLGEAVVDPFASVTELGSLDVIFAPTADLLGIRIICDIAEAPIFGDDWRAEETVREALGCPVQVMVGFTGRVQIFENGVMYWRPETGEVWAIHTGAVNDAGAFWYVGQAPDVSTAAVNAPDGYIVPGGAMGAAWLSVPEIRDALGFGLQGEVDGDVQVQRFDGGTLFLDSAAGQVFALLNNGDAYGPYTGNLSLLDFSAGDSP